ncbi:cupin domain-containing protein [Microbacterium sp. zg.B48]|uniref:cupin domain-containing protein n=1 Tax=Microbacterium sp. zg.B48 TaxID=2969408 RepID=UPI00214BB0F2|nr:cupin domain-containing protein [Microbacterium sp. zg.B48]MCR2765030.1 cupin domain-containing protein [Microbacterium sp. zg.B48]
MSTGVERGPVDRPALARLIDVPFADFARDHWDQEPLVTHKSDGFEDLFTASAVDDLIADRGTRTPFMRMAVEGTVLPAARFASSGGFGAEVADQIDSAKVLEQFAGGATIVLQGLHRNWEPIATFTRQLVRDLGHPAQVNAYITPASSRGFDPHYDTHDVFVVQIAGAKRWTIHQPVHRHPLPDQPWTDHSAAVAEQARTSPRIEAVFEPGDVLYLPRGWIHSAVAQGGTSIHLTIGVRAATRRDLLVQLLAAAGEDPSLRRQLPVGVDFTDAATYADDLAATITAARSLLERSSGDDAIGAAMRRTFQDAVRPAPVRPLATVDLIAGLHPGVILGWREGLRAGVGEADGMVRIVLSGKTIALPGEASTAVHALREQPHPAGRLPGLDPDSSLVVSRRLLREGVLTPR